MEMWEETEKKKEYLNGYKSAKRKEQRILEEIQELRLHEMFPHLQGDSMPHAHNQRDLSDYAVKLEGLLDDLEEERTKAVRKYTEIRKQIRKVKDETEQEVLEKRYMMDMTWEDIAEKMGHSTRNIYRIHGKALEHFKIN